MNRPPVAKEGVAPFVVITSAYNEDERLPRLIESMVDQQVRPECWTIVSDGSTDRTDAIAVAAAEAHDWVEFIRRERGERADTASRVSPGKVAAVEEALRALQAIDYEYVAVLDADVLLPVDYYARVLEIFASDERIGLAGGGAYNVYRDGTISDTGFVNPGFVGGPVQMFRRRCYEEIGGYVAHGHEDVLAVATAKMCGWRVVCDPDIRALHCGQERAGSWRKVPICYQMGRTDYVMHGSLWFEMLRGVRRMAAPPYVLAGASQVCGYLAALLRRTPRAPISPELLAFLRREERTKLGRKLGGGS